MTTLAQSLATSDGESERRCILVPGSLAWLNSPRRKYRVRDAIDGTLRTAIRQCVAGEADWPLLIWGDAGSGKTCAGLCMVDSFGGWAVDLPDLHGLVLKARGRLLLNSGGFVETLDGIGGVWDTWQRASLTVLDEVGQREPTDAQYDTLKRALDLREGLPAVVISNLPMPKLKRVYDDRIVSRLSAGTVIGLTGDRRLKGKH
jgi:hypothetical protein